MIRTLIHAGLVAACLWSITQSSAAAGLSYADKQVFAHGFTDLRQSGPLNFAAYPCGQITKSIIVQTSYSSLYGLRELTDNRIAIAIRHQKTIFGFGFASFGRPDYFHQMGASLFGNVSIRRLTVGMATVYHRLSFAEPYAPLTAVFGNAGLSYSVRNLLIFGVARNVYHDEFHPDDESFPAEGEGGVSLTTQNGLCSQAKALFTQGRKPTAELSQSLPLSTTASLDWVLVLYPVRFGGGVHLEWAGFGFDYRYSHHAVLGGTHVASLSVFR